MRLPLIPAAFDDVGSLALLQLASDDRTLRASAEIRRLIAGTDLEPWRLIASPKLRELRSITPDDEGIVHRGKVTLGDPSGEMRTLTGIVYRDGGEILFVLGYDIEELEKLPQQLLELNTELSNAQRKLVKANRVIRQASLTDALTGVGNRRHFDAVIEAEIDRARRYGSALSLALMDLDLFKAVNDTHGHQVGDAVLHDLGQLLASTVRSPDIPARTGGEEFAVVLPAVPDDEAVQAAERLRKLVERTELGGLSGITASFGVASFREDDSADSLYQRADEALYRAKDAGRNRVVAAP